METKSVSRARGSTQESILEAAGQLFSMQGFNGTSTREIARLARVNEASLFRLFTSKNDLFWAAVRSQLSRLRFGKELQAGLEGHAEPQVVLPLIIEFLVQTVACRPELPRLLLVALWELRPPGERIWRQHVTPILHAFSKYLLDCMEKGQIWASDPDILVYALVGGVLAQQNLYSVLEGTNLPYLTIDDATAGYSRFWVSLLVPDAGFYGARSPHFRSQSVPTPKHDTVPNDPEM
jgi:AcrR family transcriptional regulator